MQLLSVFSIVAALSAFATAAPQGSSGPGVPAPFRIKTKALGGSNPSYGDLYMSCFHSGAGECYPGFAKPKGPVFTLNDSQIYTHNGGGKDIRYVLAFGQVEDLYANWGATTLNAFGNVGTRGFTIKKNRIVNNNRRFEWAGWRVCDWVHNVPELYFDIYEDAPLPKNCESVDLVPEYV